MTLPANIWAINPCSGSLQPPLGQIPAGKTWGRYTCRSCGRKIMIRKDGLIRRHAKPRNLDLLAPLSEGQPWSGC